MLFFLACALTSDDLSLQVDAKASAGPTQAWSVSGPGDLDDFAYRIGPAGDVDGDGYGDVLVGAPGVEEAEGDGAVYLYRGSASGLSTTPDWTVYGGIVGGEVGGEGQAGVGDVNGDGYGDVLAVDANVGLRPKLYLGSAAGLDTAMSWSDSSRETSLLGAVASGDFNGDALRDLLVTNWSSGSLHVWRGTATGFARRVTFTDTRGTSSFGKGADVVGDVNGDGFDDVVVSGTTGSSSLYLGSRRGLRLSSTWSPDGSDGGAVAGVGDVDSDGYDDFVQSLDAGDGWGAVGLFRGTPFGPSSDPTWTLHYSRAPGRELGSGLARCDMDGDGAADLVVRTERGDLVTFEIYRAVGAASPGGPDWTISDPEGAGDRFDESWTPYAACLGDVDGDGDEELGIGDSSFGNDQGRAYVYDLR